MINLWKALLSIIRVLSMWLPMSLNNNTTLHFIKNSFGKRSILQIPWSRMQIYFSHKHRETQHTRATEFSRLMQQVVVIGGCNLSESICILLEFVYIHEQGSLKVVRGRIILYESSNFSLDLCHTLQETDYFSSCNLNLMTWLRKSVRERSWKILLIYFK